MSNPPNTSTTLNLSDFDQFKDIMTNVVDKLKGFSPPVVSVFSMQIAVEQDKVKKSEDTLSKIEDQQTLAQALREREKYAIDATAYKFNDNIVKQKLTALQTTELAFLSGAKPEAVYAQWTTQLREAENTLKQNKADLEGLKKQRVGVLTEWSKKSAAFNTLVTETEQLINGLGASPDQKKKTQLYNKLGKISATVPDAFYGRVLQGLHTNVLAQHYDQEVKNIRSQLKTQMENQLSTPGNKEAIKAKIDLGIGFGTFFKVGVDIASEFSYDASVGDDGKITVKKANLTSIGAKGSAGGDIGAWSAKAEGNLKGSVSISEASTFDSIDDFLDAETNRMARAFLEYSLRDNPFPVRSAKDYYKEGKSTNLREKAFKQRKELMKNAKLLGFVKEDSTITDENERKKEFAERTLEVPQAREVDFVKKREVAVAGSEEGKAEFKTGMFSAALGISQEVQHVREVKTHSIPLLENVKKHPALQEINAMKRPGHYGFAIEVNGNIIHYNGEQAIKTMKHLDEQIKLVKAAETAATAEEDKNKYKVSRLLLREQMKNALDNLQLEYESLAYIEHRVQAGNAPEDLKDAKRKFLKGRHTESSAQFVKSMTMQYAHLRRLYDNTFSDTEKEDYERESAGLEHFEKELEYPPFYIDPATAEKVFKITERSKGKKNKYKVGAYLEAKGTDMGIAGATGNLKVSVNHDSVLDESLKLKDQSLSISVQVGNSIANPGPLIQGAIELAKTRVLDKTKIPGVVGQTVEGTANFTAAINQIPAISESIKATPSAAPGHTVKADISLVHKNGGWHFKMVRFSEERSYSLGGSVTATTGQGSIKVGGSFSTSHSRTLTEFVGGNTLSYLGDVYAAQNIVGKDSKWEDYKTKKTKYFKRLFDNLKDSESNASKEMEEWLNDVTDTDTDKPREEFQNVLEEFRNGTKQQADVMTKLDVVMKKRLEKSRDEQYKKFVINMSTNNLTEYAAHVMAKGIDDFTKEYAAQGITTEQAKDTTGIREWAKAHYKNQPNDDNMNILKKAYALEYAQNTLNDLLADGLDTDKNTALKLLDHDYISEAYKEPKVYISKGVSGALRTELGTTANGSPKTTVYVDVTADKDAKVPYDLEKRARSTIEDITGLRLFNNVGKKEQKTDDGSKDLLMSDVPVSSKGAFTDAKKRKKFAEKIARVLEASRKLKNYKKSA